MDDTIEYEELSIWNINSITYFIKNNVFQILLLILVFVIIYVVDYISNINSMIFSMPSPITGLSSSKIKKIRIKKNKN
jgi:hypothetical protein